jgi:hypothetical protein
MAEIYNAGADIIGAYFKGRQVRQQREKLKAEVEIAGQIATDRQEKMQQQYQIAVEKEKNLEKWRELQDQNKKSEIKLKEFESFVSNSEAFQKGWLEMIDPEKGIRDQSNLRETPRGTAARLAAEGEMKKQEMLLPGKVEEERLKLLASLPLKTTDAVNRAQQLNDNIFIPNQKRQQDFTAEQNRLNREALRDRSREQMATRITIANNKLKAGEIDENDYVQTHVDAIQNGSVTIEDLQKTIPKEKLLKIVTRARGNGLRVFTNKEKDEFNSLEIVERFHDNAQKLSNLINKQDPASGYLDPKVEQLRKELDSDLVLFGRFAKGEKGVVTDKDVNRLGGSVPSLFPGGVRDILALEGIKAGNERRVGSILEVYQGIAKKLTKGMPKKQRDAVYERFGIREIGEDPPKDPRGKNPNAVPVE